MGNTFLDLYLSFLEGLGHLLPPPKMWPFIHLTGHWYRPGSYKKWEQKVLSNLAPFFVRPGKILREILHFEMRMALENAFILRRDQKKIRACFDHYTWSFPAPCIIICGHFFNYWLLVEALWQEGQEVVLILGQEPRASKSSSPVEKRGLKMWRAWAKRIQFILREEGQAYEKCAEALAQGKRLFLLVDVPEPKGPQVPFLKGHASIPTGWLHLAQRFQVPLFGLWPSTPSCLDKYKWRVQNLGKVSENAPRILSQVLAQIEQVALLYPASWIGWLYLSELKGNA